MLKLSPTDTFTKDFGDPAQKKTFFEDRNRTANLYKTYSNRYDHYSAITNNNLDRKFDMLQNRCDQIKSKNEDRPEVLSITSIESAELFYYDDLHGMNLSPEYMAMFVKRRFKTPERARVLNRKFEFLTFQTVLLTNPSKTLIDCLE